MTYFCPKCKKPKPTDVRGFQGPFATVAARGVPVCEVHKIEMEPMEDLDEILDDVETELDETIHAVKRFIKTARAQGKTRLAGEAEAYILGHLKGFKDDEHQNGSVASLRDGIKEDAC